MITRLFNTTKDDIKEAAKILSLGGLVAFPTETVYGLGADAFDKDAAKKAYAAKGRPSDNPLIVHIASFDDMYRLVPKEILDGTKTGDLARKLSDSFWPGPLTMVLPKKEEVPLETTGGLDTVAIRMPNEESTLEFIRLSKTLVSGPSANTSGHPSPTTWQHVKHDLDGKIDGIICGVPCEGGIESTVVSLVSYEKDNELVILRPGLVTPEMIEHVTGCHVIYDEALLKKPELDSQGNAKDNPAFHPKAPGMKYKHYAPKAKMLLLKNVGYKEGFLDRVEEYVQKEEEKGQRVCLVLPDARNFYAGLRSADENNADLILTPISDDNSSIYFSVMNRVLKAAAYNIIEI